MTVFCMDRIPAVVLNTNDTEHELKLICLMSGPGSPTSCWKGAGLWLVGWTVL